MLGEDFERALAKRERALADELIDWYARRACALTPTDWCLENLQLRSTTIRDRFIIEGREYLREPIDDIADDDLHFQSTCWATGCAKTTKNVCQMAYVFENDPSSMLYVVPSAEGQGGAREFNNTCIVETIKATPCFKDKIPRGKGRHDFGGMKCIFGGNILHFAGANSPGQLAGPRRRIVWLDESDKFKEQLGREASADYLANERTKQVPRSKLIRGSTPSLIDFGIWPHLLDSDLRRRFVSCPECGRHHPSSRRFVLVQSLKFFQTLPLAFEDGGEIAKAQMRWDDEARRKDKSWDMDRVVRSARFECPFCGFHIRDEHRVALDKGGVWIATQPSKHLHKGYHLPSFYAPHVNFESSFGGIAKKYLDAFASPTGMRGYINSELAEAYVGQENSSSAIEINSRKIAGPDWHTLMTVDFQKTWPFIWFLVQKWSSFKLQPRLPLVDGQPQIDLAQSPKLKELFEKVAGENIEARAAFAELLRFDARTGEFHHIDWCASHGVVKENLARIYNVTCDGHTLDFGRYIFREMGEQMPTGGDSEIVAAGHCELSGDDAWRELRDYQLQFHVGETFQKNGISPNNAVLIDAGYMERHNPEVLMKCYESGREGRFEYYEPSSKSFIAIPVSRFCLPVPVDGWLPFKGYPIRKRWRVGGIEREWRFAPDDPFKGTSESNHCIIAVLEAASDLYFHRWMDCRDRQREIADAIKYGRPYKGNIWSVSSAIELFPKQTFTMEHFNTHMGARYRDEVGEIHDKGEGGWSRRRYPAHLNDCARNQFALADCNGVFSYDDADLRKQPTQK